MTASGSCPSIYWRRPASTFISQHLTLYHSAQDPNPLLFCWYILTRQYSPHSSPLIDIKIRPTLTVLHFSLSRCLPTMTTVPRNFPSLLPCCSYNTFPNYYSDLPGCLQNTALSSSLALCALSWAGVGVLASSELLFQMLWNTAQGWRGTSSSRGGSVSFLRLSPHQCPPHYTDESPHRWFYQI